MRKSLLAAASAGILATGLLASPALAESGPTTTATVTVPTTVTVSGVSPAIAFPDTPPGQTATVNGAETYTVSTNNSKGYHIQLDSSGGCGGANFCDASGDAIPDTNLSVTETGTAAGALSFDPSTGNATINDTTGPTTGSGDQYTENWALKIPSSAVGGTYSETYTYSALAH